ncbi:hypothetical protein Acr_00g0031050 [Actinidia rufa]|uniref:Uncharacterized protein n=1 Tax=Actinidia rufa TaxID=165716 RepID=A0A7J0DGY3_9ERIC|nr:hypothetical protein Acr_00g0031050 [Actinidia rufa]
MTDRSNGEQRSGRGWVGPNRFPRSYYTPCDPNRRKSGDNQRRRRTSGCRGKRLGPCRCSSGTSGTGSGPSWASGPSATSPAPPRPTRSRPVASWVNTSGPIFDSIPPIDEQSFDCS